jgi:hypothetical protein
MTGQRDSEMNSIYEAIESKYGFAIPSSYREMNELGWFDRRDKSRCLWICEAEFMTPDEILSYEPQEYHKPGFVPFASTGRGDKWCWWPAENCVVLCPRDCSEGEVDAPDFLSSLYRRMLEYASGGFDREDEEEARQHLRNWASRLSPFFPPVWIGTLTDASLAPLIRWERGRAYGDGFLSLDEEEMILRRDLDFPRLDEKFDWMYP